MNLKCLCFKKHWSSLSFVILLLVFVRIFWFHPWELHLVCLFCFPARRPFVRHLFAVGPLMGSVRVPGWKRGVEGSELHWKRIADWMCGSFSARTDLRPVAAWVLPHQAERFRQQGLRCSWQDPPPLACRSRWCTAVAVLHGQEVRGERGVLPPSVCSRAHAFVGRAMPWEAGCWWTENTAPSHRSQD